MDSLGFSDPDPRTCSARSEAEPTVNIAGQQAILTRKCWLDSSAYSQKLMNYVGSPQSDVCARSTRHLMHPFMTQLSYSKAFGNYSSGQLLN